MSKNQENTDLPSSADPSQRPADPSQHASAVAALTAPVAPGMPRRPLDFSQVILPAETASELSSSIPTKKIDLHCHSSFSNEHLFGLFFFPLLQPTELYDLAKKRGMDYVTITDHDSIEGCLDLLSRRGELSDFIVGEEISAVFPDDNMVVHVNVFDIDEAQHREIQRLRRNIFELVPYLKSLGKLHQLNHFTWNARHLPFSVKRIEQLVELFDVFEVINGTRTYHHNSLAWKVLDGLHKAHTAGSDSHTDGVGTAFTTTVGESKHDVLHNISMGRTIVTGRYGSQANTRRDTRLLLRSNLRRMMNTRLSRSRKVGAALGFAALRTISLPVTLGYYFKENRRMSQFADACADVLARRISEPTLTAGNSSSTQDLWGGAGAGESGLVLGK